MSEQATQSEISELELGSESALTEPLQVQDFSTVEILTLLAQRKWTIAKFIGAALLLGIVLCFTLPVRYTASTKVMPPQQNPSTAMMLNQLTANGTNPLATLAGSALGMRSPNEIYVGLVQSRTVADAIIQKFELMKVYRAKDATAARKKLSEFTEVTSEKSGFISVSVTDGDKQRAADIANEYISQLRSISKSMAVTEAAQRRLFYEDQIKTAKESLLEAEAAFLKVQQAKGIIQPEAQARAMIESLARMRGEVAAKSVELQALRSFSTERNPELQVAEEELASMRSQVASLEQNSHSAEFSDLSMKDVPGAGLEYLAAQHEVLYRQTLFDLLLKQYDAARLDESKEATVIQIVESAVRPDRKSAPNRPRVLILCFVLGLLVGCMYSVGTNRIQESPELGRSINGFIAALTSR